MTMFKVAVLCFGGLISFASRASAHGHVQGIVMENVWYDGYDPSFQYLSTAPVVIGWADPEDLDNGYVAPSNFSSSDIICHKDASNAQTSATVKAGDVVEFQWTDWPDSHHGPVIDYLARCENDDCTTVDKTGLEFFKIDEVGLVDDTTVPGTWASDQLINNNNSWTVTIPSSIEAGNYVLRHEIIALHGAGSVDGAQNYPQCINIQVTGGGSETPTGTLGTALYQESDAGILINIYETLSTYVIPGPTLWSGATSMSQTQLTWTSYYPTTAAATDAAAATASVESTSAAAAASVVTSAADTYSASAVAATSTSAYIATSYDASAYATSVDIASATSVSAASATTSASYSSWGSTSNSNSNSDSDSDSDSDSSTLDQTVPDGMTLRQFIEWANNAMDSGDSSSETKRTFIKSLLNNRLH